ncbi:Hypothetical protein NTJ_06067 [Nesidiocoris tenuis]|uniref:Uncharacterized protein n=1 Tax=Nesidiocoris tenuis TaxID=355587 RepID=A0ABN7AMI4_9HEMI|nr:Hypothetical protein NTJ_06067 [Nesidiocoris tenuis]
MCGQLQSGGRVGRTGGYGSFALRRMLMPSGTLPASLPSPHPSHSPPSKGLLINIIKLRNALVTSAPNLLVYVKTDVVSTTEVWTANESRSPPRSLPLMRPSSIVQIGHRRPRPL